MSKLREPYKCDGCGKLRTNDANHWWLLEIRTHVESTGAPLQWPILNVRAWGDDALPDFPQVKHACGQDCASQLIARWMATGSFDPPSSRPLSQGVAPSGATSPAPQNSAALAAEESPVPLPTETEKTK